MSRLSLHTHSNIAASLVAVAMVLLCLSCIKNDIPYPHIQANFLTLNAATQDQGTKIDSINRQATLYFPETTDIYNVKITDYTLTQGAEIVSGSITDGLDLSKPAKITLHLYYDYIWTINGVQDIQRCFKLDGQIGPSVIDVAGRRVIASISAKANIECVHVDSIKLGPEGSVMTPDLNGKNVDFSSEIAVDVTNHGRTETWRIYVTTTENAVTTTSVDAWTCVAWAYGEAESSRKNGFEYRLVGDTDWTIVPEEYITHQGGSFYARIIHLDPLTSYEVRATSDDQKGDILQFTTGSRIQVPNTNLDNWWLDGKVWCPWAEGGEQYWDTGNKGATTLGSSNSVPTDDTSSGSGWAAKLETKFIGIGIIGKLAAGNIFVGRYVRTDGTNGVLSFGKPFTERPTRLRGYLKYTDKNITHASSELASLKGQPDTCSVWCALIDSDEPFEIRTNPNNRQLFEPNLPIVVAYGSIQFGETIPDYIPFEFDLKYTATNRKPKYIIITASASKYGDYFTGGNGSVLYIDDLKLLYDFESEQ